MKPGLSTIALNDALFLLAEFFRLENSLYLTQRVNLSSNIVWYSIETTLDELILLLNFIQEQKYK